MIIVRMVGGVGNQLFCYAYAKSLQQRGYEVKIDVSTFKFSKIDNYEFDKYDIDIPISTQEENEKLYNDSFISKILWRFGIDISAKVREKSLLFDEKLLNINDHSYVDGYFQNEKYFCDIRGILLEQISINRPLSNFTKNIQKKINSLNNTCSIHVRRGDMANDINVKIHGVCSLEYYQNAIKYLENKLGKINYFIFSDDFEWCRSNLKLDNAIFVNSEEKRIAHEDIYLMSICNHNIIANSSFSWWGAWLNINDDKIVTAPKDWFSDRELKKQAAEIVPEDWIRI
ncbi:alpha-1,2-fucosyltransferase [Gammaproteobacteria bacterium]|nr:alpha-1,2-fucosyltransferase [Gammaproteobacteria bacterium]